MDRKIALWEKNYIKKAQSQQKLAHILSTISLEQSQNSSSTKTLSYTNCQELKILEILNSYVMEKPLQMKTIF